MQNLNLRTLKLEYNIKFQASLLLYFFDISGLKVTKKGNEFITLHVAKVL